MHPTWSATYLRIRRGPDTYQDQQDRVARKVAGRIQYIRFQRHDLAARVHMCNIDVASLSAIAVDSLRFRARLSRHAKMVYNASAKDHVRACRPKCSYLSALLACPVAFVTYIRRFRRCYVEPFSCLALFLFNACRAADNTSDPLGSSHVCSGPRWAPTLLAKTIDSEHRRCAGAALATPSSESAVVERGPGLACRCLARAFKFVSCPRPCSNCFAYSLLGLVRDLTLL